LGIVENPQLIVTLDYEIFGNGSGALQPCVLEPTNRILKLAEAVAAPVTIFVDAACFSVMELANQDVSLIKRQLCNAVVQGHDVQLHLHPQWTDPGQFTDGQWHLELDKWRIADNTDKEIYKQVVSGCRWLEEVIAKVKPEYHCSAFRAGGWCIQPSRKILAILAECGFAMDSSVAPGAYNLTKGQWFDFRGTPEKGVWWLQEDVCKAEIKTRSHLLEVPITTANIGATRHLRALLAMRRRANGGLAPECCGVYDGPSSKWQSMAGKVSKASNLGRVMLDFSTLPADVLITTCEQWLEKYEENAPGLTPLVAIGHTKNFSLESESQFNEFLSWAKAEGYTFTTYPEWFDNACGSLE